MQTFNQLYDFYKKQGKPIKLNLGCYNRKFPDYINIDIRETDCDLVDNAVTLEKIPDNSCDLIESVHMLEHLSYKDTDIALKTWYNKLKPGGLLRVSVPNIKVACALLLATDDKESFKTNFCGSQVHEADFHLNIHTPTSLTKDLEKTGFKNIVEFDWQTTPPHNYCDSYASAYWPSFRKKFLQANGKEIDLGGILMSLNLQGEK